MSCLDMTYQTHLKLIAMNFFNMKSTSTNYQKILGKRVNHKHKKWLWLVLVLPLMIFSLIKKEKETSSPSFKETSAISEAQTNPDLWNENGPFDGFSPKAELISHRDKNAKHFPNENGSTTAIISNASIHYEETDGIWQEIDPKLTISSRAGFSYENTTNGIKSWYPDAKGKKAVLMEVKGQPIIPGRKNGIELGG